jgi:hypothetical protein
LTSIAILSTTNVAGTLVAASGEALSARQPGSSTVATTMRPHSGQDENTEVSMSTTTTDRLEPAPTVPEWRRICHRYIGYSQQSVCGTANRKPGEGHGEAECAARCHTICVVCTELVDGAPRNP